VKRWSTYDPQRPVRPWLLGIAFNVYGDWKKTGARRFEEGRDELPERGDESDLEARVGHPIAARFAIRHRIHVLKRLKWAFDENSDGSLSTDERTAMVDAMEARCLRLRAAVLEKFDANTDGALDAAEKQAAKAALQAKVQALKQAVLTKYDVNGNGALDDGERLALRSDRIAAFKTKRAEVVARFDTNADGRLNDAEKLALKRAIQQRVAEGKDAE